MLNPPESSATVPDLAANRQPGLLSQSGHNGSITFAYYCLQLYLNRNTLNPESDNKDYVLEALPEKLRTAPLVVGKHATNSNILLAHGTFRAKPSRALAAYRTHGLRGLIHELV